jgi:inorganic triphosphatase YgiF
MASESNHLRKAEKNQAFLDTISDEFPDWLAIVAFYKAVHLVEAIFARRGSPSHDHRDRNMKLKRAHPEIWKHFGPLYKASKWLRYTDQTIDASEVREELIGKRLKTIESLVFRELNIGRSN